jgi:ferritin
MGMEFGKRVGDLLNKQISEEFGSAYLYVAMAASLKDMGLDGCSNWMLEQSKEECRHAMKIFNHMSERGAKVKLLPITPPRAEWRAPLHIFEEMQRHEQKVTAMITAIYETATLDKDYQTQCFISWFINEQVEEEATATSLLNKLRRMQSTDLGVLMFDAELAKRA